MFRLLLAQGVIQQLCNNFVSHGSKARFLRGSEKYHISVADNSLLFPTVRVLTRSSATAKSTARPSCLVGVLYDIYRETNDRSTANQPLVRNWL